MPRHTPRAPALPIRLAVWYGKGGVGKSTTTILLSLLAARSGARVLTIDLDPECGTSRDFFGRALSRVPDNLLTFLESPLPVPPNVVSSGIDSLDLLPSVPDQERFFRYFPEHSGKLREGLDLLPPGYRYVFMDVPNQFDNIAQLGLIAADYLILPVELTADCVERVDTALRILTEVRAENPALRVVGALALASSPKAGRDLHLSAKELLVYRQYVDALRPAGIKLFRTLMFRSASTVEEARSNASVRLLHWSARRRFQALLNEIHLRIRALAPMPFPRSHAATQERRRTQAAPVR